MARAACALALVAPFDPYGLSMDAKSKGAATNTTRRTAAAYLKIVVSHNHVVSAKEPISMVRDVPIISSNETLFEIKAKRSLL